MRRRIQIIIIILILITGTGISMFIHNKSNKEDMSCIDLSITGTDKSMYSPKEEIKITYLISNIGTQESKDIKLFCKVTHLEQVMEEIPIETIRLNPGEKKEMNFKLEAPDQDFTGYLVEIYGAGAKKSVVSDTIGIDVSSSWVKFPRYGYLCDFGEKIDADSKISLMNRYHINGIEYYDWHYLHHQPLADHISREQPGSWQDWSGRLISGKTVTSYIKAARQRNMVNMAYNMIYAGTDTFFVDKDGKATKVNDWKLYFAKNNDRGKGPFTFYMGTSPSGNGNLYFLNPLNKEWQQHIFSEELKIFQVFDFDGWHGDTVGDWGPMETAEGLPLGYDDEGKPIYYVKDTYTQFLNAAKEALGDKYLSFNPVGAQGIENANVSKTDVLYTEFWPWDKDREGKSYDTYASLVREIERSNKDSKETSFDGKGKSLVVKAYINYDKTNGNMNPPGVLLADAAVYAAGGSRLELGNGDRMLHVEYYPKDFPMDDKLQNHMKRVADFIVAYENLLRDGQETTKHDVAVKGFPVSKEGEANQIWAYTRADFRYEIIHLINLLGTDNKWRDERGKKEVPQEVKDLKVTYYTDKEISKIYVASPDYNNCKSQELSFKTGADERGKFVTFTLPLLYYWDMIYMK